MILYECTGYGFRGSYVECALWYIVNEVPNPHRIITLLDTPKGN